MATFIHNQSSSASILRKFSVRESPWLRISKGRSKPLPLFVFGELCYYYLPDQNKTKLKRVEALYLHPADQDQDIVNSRVRFVRVVRVSPVCFSVLIAITVHLLRLP